MNELIVHAVNAIGATLLEDNEQWQNRIQIKSASSTRLYIVAQRKSNGEWGCSCPGHIFYQYQPCKHLQAMLPLLESLPIPGKVDELKRPNEPEIREINSNQTDWNSQK